MSMIQTSEQDAIPEEFSLEDFQKNGFSDEEIAAMTTGDNAVFTVPDAAKPEEDEPETDAIGSAPQMAPEADQQEAAPQRPAQVEIPDTTEAQKAIDGFDAKIEALQSEYDDGSFTAAEFRNHMSALAKEQAKAQALLDQAASIAQSAQQSALDHWNERLNAYKADAEGLWSEQHIGNWDRHLRTVTMDAALSALTRDQQIAIAHRRYADEYAAVNGKPLEIAPVSKKAAQQGQQFERRSDPRPNAPTTLAGFNGEADSMTSQDSMRIVIEQKMAKDPFAAEAALAAMGADAEDDFLAQYQ